MRRIILFCVIIVVLAGIVNAECVDLGNGKDGSLTVTSANTIINTYTQIISTTVSSGSTSFDVSDASAFSVGDEILVIQMQHSSNAGIYEFAEISGISSNTITVSTGLTNNYYSGTLDTTSASASQIVRVPQYTDVNVNSDASITSSAWNGYIGGIVVFRANGIVDVIRSIDVSGKGFRGGKGGGNVNGDNYGGSGSMTGERGESWLGKSGSGGGNGGKSCSGWGIGGGGGGAYATNGLTSSAVYGSCQPPTVSGGDNYGQADLSVLFFGSGGGGGSSNYNMNYPGTHGGNGGGIIIIYANNVIINSNGNISANGEIVGGAYSGGGGSGGSVHIYSDTITINGAVTSEALTIPTGTNNVGGKGSVGRIRLDYNTLSGTTNPSPGYQLSNITICITDIIPTYTKFTSEETTNFSEDTNLTEVKNLTLAVPNKGKIKFGQYGINAESADFDKHVRIENTVISVNTSALHSTFNNSATLTFENINCNFPYVYYSDTEITGYGIMAEDKLCLPPRCTNIQCSAGTLTVDVAHFSGYAVNGTANLTINADDPKYIDQLVTFTAEYMNSTGPITDATCSISFSDDSYIMDAQADYYNYSRTFASAQIVDYNVTCSATGENTVFANDTAVIQSIDIPEFSTITLGLGLIAVLGGLVIIRKKK